MTTTRARGFVFLNLTPVYDSPWNPWLPRHQSIGFLLVTEETIGCSFKVCQHPSPVSCSVGTTNITDNWQSYLIIKQQLQFARYISFIISNCGQGRSIDCFHISQLVTRVWGIHRSALLICLSSIFKAVNSF